MVLCLNLVWTFPADHVAITDHVAMVDHVTIADIDNITTQPTPSPSVHPDSHHQQRPTAQPKFGDFNPKHTSSRTTFSTEEPSSPPWDTMDTTPRRRRHLREKKETTHPREHHHVHVCDQVSGWVVLDYAEDSWGNNVTIVQEIDVGGVRVNQFFYETRCREERNPCTGIDTSKYRSQCRNKYSWVYANVYHGNTIGWRFIRISSSCNCALQKRSRNDYSNIFGNEIS